MVSSITIVIAPTPSPVRTIVPEYIFPVSRGIRVSILEEEQPVIKPVTMTKAQRRRKLYAAVNFAIRREPSKIFMQDPPPYLGFAPSVPQFFTGPYI